MWIGGWTAFGVFFTTHTALNQVYQGEPPRWLYQLTRWLVYSYVYCALTPIILWTSRRYPLERDQWLTRVPIHIAMSLCLACVATLLCGPFAYMLTNEDGTPFVSRILLDLFVLAFQYHILIYWAVVGLEHGLEYYRRFRERELHAGQLQAQLAQAQLDALKMQLHPHFLFNTLNSVSVLMQTDVQAAKQTLVCLSHLLRGALQASKGHEVTLRSEVELLRSYLEIEQTRFHDRLSTSVSVDPVALDAQVPYFILQPLVENAIRHGDAGRIEITASRVNGSVRLEVCDDGPGIHEGATPGSGNGIGLANTRARLEKLYGAEHSFELRNAPGGGVVAVITIPFRVNEPGPSEPTDETPWNESAY
jgi:sensor histidine kinase YesM